MSTSQQVPDYELDDVHIVTSNQELKAMFDPFRGALLQLLLERAASVQELAIAVQRPKSTVAYHVGLLVEAGMLKVVRTRMIRGQEERFYGRTARLFGVGQITPEQTELIPNPMAEWAAETGPAHANDRLRAIKRYAWIDDDVANEFWDRVLELVNEFSQLPSSGRGQAHAFMTTFYPTEHPRLPERQD
ncbi:ArsR/SmtB family transcription factor [Kribbella sp. NPDC051586]|uniref:ArsR/SmtB family transcription factor n=1 Tax=Kribbella sp. NPDC051586 TaxID=3364118 RepID=UPI00379A74CA